MYVFTQGLNVKQVFYCYIVITLVFIVDSFLAKLLVVIFLYLNVNEPEGNTMYYLTLPSLCDVCKFVFCYGFRQYDFSWLSIVRQNNVASAR